MNRHSSVVSSAPSILRPQVRIPSTPSMHFFNLYRNCNDKRTKINKKRQGLAHFLKKRVELRLAKICATKDLWSIWNWFIYWWYNITHLGLVVIGGDLCPEGRGFKSQRRILDGHFFTHICCINCNVCSEKTKIMKNRSDVLVKCLSFLPSIQTIWVWILLKFSVLFCKIFEKNKHEQKEVVDGPLKR